VALSFVSYHLMVGIGVFFIGLTLVASLSRLRGTLYSKRWLMWVFVFAVGPAFIANEAGWVAAEVGRQPWVVYPPLVTGDDGKPIQDAEGFYKFDETQGLRTKDGVSQALVPAQVMGSLVMFGAIYTLLFVVWVYVLHQKITHGPEPTAAPPEPKRPLQGALAAAADRPAHDRSLTEPKKQ
jgi:cytochrome d ubiquinol oxidase subunit I